jgi:hypothetical protein
MAGETISSVVIAKWVVWGLGSLFGGLTHALVDLRANKIKDKQDFWALVAVSTFAGAAWCIAIQKIYDGDLLISLLGGMLGGFMSLNGLSILLNVIIKLKTESTNNKL